MDDQRDYAEEAANRADMVREGEQEVAAAAEYRRLIDSGVRTPAVVARIVYLAGQR